MKNKITSTTIRSHYVSARLTRNFDKTPDTFLIPFCRWQLFQIIPNKLCLLLTLSEIFSNLLSCSTSTRTCGSFASSSKIFCSVLLTKFELPEVEVCESCRSCNTRSVSISVFLVLCVFFVVFLPSLFFLELSLFLFFFWVVLYCVALV